METTAKTVEAAKEAALDRLGVAADEAEFDVLDEPRPGLFGRTRGEGRVRARVKPAHVRPKQERRRRGAKSSSGDATPSGSSAGSGSATEHDSTDDVDADELTTQPSTDRAATSTKPDASSRPSNGRPRGGRDNDRTRNSQEKKMSNEEREPSPVSPQEVGDAAVLFMDGLVAAFGSSGSTSLEVDGTELDVQVDGEGLGLLVGPGGRTLNAVQDLARVSAQRRLGDHETRLRIDVAGYRARRSEALQRFAVDVAASVRESGTPRALEPMNSADRKVIHDALNDEDGVESRSEGDDPNRRIVVVPA
ncbi:MAG: RNA-binding cell elongation regulator Jag/EloR [Ilumatobacter sp.]